MSVIPFSQEEKQPPDKSPGGSSVVPEKGKTSSYPEMTTSSWIQGLFQSYAGLGYSLPFEILSYIELISTYNPDFSQAVDNVRTLANSGHELFIDAQAQRTAARIKSRLEEKSRTIQERHGGVDGLIDKLLDQAAVYGAMCFRGDTEVITKQGIKKIADLSGTTATLMSKRGRWVEAPVRSFGVQPLRKIVLRRRTQQKEIWATPEHRWLVEAKRGDSDAYAVRPPKGISRSLSSWQVDRQTDELCPGDKLVTVTPDQQAGNLCNTPVSPIGVAQGVVYGDGCAPRSARGVIVPAEVALYGDNVNDLLKFFPLSNTRSLPNGDVKVVGLPRSWKTDKPDLDRECSTHLLGWLAGYFAADGHVTSSGTAVLTSCERSNLEYVRDAFARLGVVCYSIRRKDARGGGACWREGEYDQFILTFPSGAVPESFFVRPHHVQRRRELNLSSWKVISVEDTGVRERVYCAVVPELHCFALEGNILTGNCGEWVTTEDLTDIVDFQDVNPKSIRFFWDNEYERYVPFQKVNASQLELARQRGQEIRNSCVRLNETTFHYYAFDAMPGSPYGTPPFLAALANIAIQRDMVGNMAQIVKKVGLLGMIDISVKALPPKPGEQNDTYQSRAKAFLQEYVGVLEGMVRDGGIAHFDDVEVQTYQLAGNAAGATNIFKQNEELIFSGLKSMPSVQGRCLDPSTRILMADGTTKLLKEVRIGDLLQAFDEHTGCSRRRWHAAKVENVWQIRKKSLRLHFSDGRTVLCGEDHPFLMQKQNAGSNKLDRQTGNPRARRDAAIKAAETRWHNTEDEFKGTDWKRASSIRAGEWIKALDEPLPINYDSDDYRAGYVAGVTEGDGCYREKVSGKTCYWQVAVQESDDLIIDYCEMYARRLGMPEQIFSRFIREPNRNPQGSSFAGTQRMTVLKTCRKANVEFFAGLCVERASNNYKAGWLAGLMDTDGSLHKKSRGREQLRICQNDGRVKDQAEKFISDLGFVSSRSSKWLEILGDRLERWRFTATIQPVLDRKCVTLDDHTVRTFKPVCVERVEVLGYRDLIDLTTTTETLVANGLCAHNSYSSTETYAGVAYDIIIRNTYKYQRAVKRMIEAGYWLMVTFWGETPDAIRLVFNSNKSLHRLQDAQAFRLEIFNAVLLWALGIWNQQDVAQALGEQDPKQVYEEVPESPLLGPPPTIGISAKGTEEEGATSASKIVKQVLAALSEDEATGV